MIALVFSYEVRDAEAFERAYGPDGEWAQFFRQGPWLHRHRAAPRRRDAGPVPRRSTAGRSAEAYNDFAAAHRDEYMRRVDDTRFHYDQELRFGTFENVWHE